MRVAKIPAEIVEAKVLEGRGDRPREMAVFRAGCEIDAVGEDGKSLKCVLFAVVKIAIWCSMPVVKNLYLVYNTRRSTKWDVVP